MSCRSTPGGRAASSCGTALSGGSADLASRLIHEMRAHYAAENPDAPAPDLGEVIEVLERLAHHVRHDNSLSSKRRGQAISRVNDAMAAYRSGDHALPDWPTLQAWSDLPAAMTADRLAVESAAQSTGRADAPASRSKWDLPDMSGDDVPDFLRYVEFAPEVLLATDQMFNARPSRLSLDEAGAVFGEWIQKTSSHYGVPEPRLEWDPSVVTVGGGRYIAEDRVIRMSHVSIMTLLHEFRHHLQFQGTPMATADTEEDARAWSMSLYSRVRPDLFERFMREGRFLGVSERYM